MTQLGLNEKGQMVALRPTALYRAWSFGYGWVELTEGLLAIATLGFCRPPWLLRYGVWGLRNTKRMWLWPEGPEVKA